MHRINTNNIINLEFQLQNTNIQDSQSTMAFSQLDLQNIIQQQKLWGWNIIYITPCKGLLQNILNGLDNISIDIQNEIGTKQNLMLQIYQSKCKTVQDLYNKCIGELVQNYTNKDIQKYILEDLKQILENLIKCKSKIRKKIKQKENRKQKDKSKEKEKKQKQKFKIAFKSQSLKPKRKNQDNINKQQKSMASRIQFFKKYYKTQEQIKVQRNQKLEQTQNIPKNKILKIRKRLKQFRQNRKTYHNQKQEQHRNINNPQIQQQRKIQKIQQPKQIQNYYNKRKFNVKKRKDLRQNLQTDDYKKQQQLKDRNKSQIEDKARKFGSPQKNTHSLLYLSSIKKKDECKNIVIEFEDSLDLSKQ